MAEHLNSVEGGAHINTSCHRATVIGNTTPARRRSDEQSLLVIGARPIKGKTVAIAWLDTQPDPTAPVVQAAQDLDRMADWIIGGIGVAGVLGLVSLCWWLGHGGKWVPLW